MTSLRGRRVFVAGASGLVGRALVRRLSSEACDVLTVPRAELDLRDQRRTFDWLARESPDVVIVAAARVGGILANSTEPAQFAFDNLAIATNLIEGAHRAGVGRVLYLGSSCIYPRLAPQPIPESAFMTGPLEPTCAPYAMAKIAGIGLCDSYRAQYGLDYISAMPTNLYGPGDKFDLTTSHVLPALIRKAHEAKLSAAPELLIWGTGTPRREFLHVDDCADALVLLLKTYSGDQHVNVGSGEDVTILELAELVARVVGYGGKIVTDPSKPDGAPRKLMSGDRIKSMGWRPSIPLAAGIASTYEWFRRHHAT